MMCELVSFTPVTYMLVVAQEMDRVNLDRKLNRVKCG